jgi:hypothetical protein
VSIGVEKKISGQKEAPLDELLRDIERFIKAQGITPTRFGREAVKDPNFVFDLRDGREPRRRVRDAAKKYMLTFGAVA